MVTVYFYRLINWLVAGVVQDVQLIVARTANVLKLNEKINWFGISVHDERMSVVITQTFILIMYGEGKILRVWGISNYN